MTVTNVTTDPERLTMTITGEFAAPVDRTWRLWEDPRLLERWWGPPTYPATFVDFDLTPGGRASYFMTGPQGDQPRGWWRILEVDAPHSLEFENGFADEGGEPAPGSPETVFRVALHATSGGGTSMVVVVTYASVAAMEKLLAMGMREGLLAAMGQMDGLVA